MDFSSLKVALVHEWLVSSRGAERCLEVFCELFPRSEIFTLFHRPGSVSEAIESRPIHTSFLQKFPGVRRYYRHLLPLMPLAAEQFDLSGFDLVISGNSCVAKGVIVPLEIPHICYMYSPMRYAWDLQWNYFGEESGVRKLRRSAIFQMLHKLRVWDVAAASRVDQFVAVSGFVADRVRKCYRCESDIVYPPVDVDRFRVGKEDEREDYFLMVTTFEPNKRVDLAVDAFNEIGLPLKIVGSAGRLGASLQRRAKENIEFLGWKSDENVAELYRKAKAVVVPGVEDFGIVTVEAMASGTPVIGYKGGGVAETVMDKGNIQTGLLFDDLEVKSLRGTVEECNGKRSWDHKGIRNYSENFCENRFRNEVKTVLEKAYNTHSIHE